jgi:hypothetical protein
MLLVNKTLTLHIRPSTKKLIPLFPLVFSPVFFVAKHGGYYNMSRVQRLEYGRIRVINFFRWPERWPKACKPLLPLNLNYPLGIFEKFTQSELKDFVFLRHFFYPLGKSKASSALVIKDSR